MRGKTAINSCLEEEEGGGEVGKEDPTVFSYWEVASLPPVATILYASVNLLTESVRKPRAPVTPPSLFLKRIGAHVERARRLAAPDALLPSVLSER